MEKHADRFTGRVSDYERYRLRYPQHVLDILRERCGLRREDVVADIGAGTGMLAELFLEAGHRVFAVEPNAEMRAVCERLAERFGGLKVVAATAENTGLEDGTINLVSVGRAFHWFDQTRALAEFKRILKPGGWVVVTALRRAQKGSDQTCEYENLLLEHGIKYDELRAAYRSFDGLRPYGDAETFEVALPGEQTLSFETFVGQTQSLSITPMPGHEKYDGMQQALREFFAKWSVEGALRLETMCEVVGWRTPE